MNRIWIMPAIWSLAALSVWAQASHPALLDGTITVTNKNGERVQILPGKKCTDLWVSPDESIIAFIAIEEEKPADKDGIEAFIQKSTIYVAQRTDDFRPVHVPAKISIDHRIWDVVREPKVSPDRRTIYFFVPDTMAAWTLIGKRVPDGRQSVIGKAKDYCVVWGGGHSGDLAILARQEATPGDPASGVAFSCSVRDRSGTLTKLKDCWDAFSEVTNQWSRESGGTCK
jgi:hypothetical protein